jgi:hypothetical protein
LSEDRKTIIYINGDLILKNCANIIFYGNIKNIVNSEFVCDCQIISINKKCNLVHDILNKKNNNNYFDMNTSKVRTKKKIMKELSLDFWGQSKNIIGNK